MSNKELNVGDVVYSTQYGKVTGREKITRVTKTQAVIAKGLKFHRSCKSGFIKRVGSGSFNSVFYQLENDKIKEEYEKAVLVSKLSRFNWGDLSIEKLKKVVKELNNVSSTS